LTSLAGSHCLAYLITVFEPEEIGKPVDEAGRRER
jgi:hypothetical protein